MQIVFSDNLDDYGLNFILHGLNKIAKEKRNMQDMKSFAFSLIDEKKQFQGGIEGISYYGCLYLDLLYIDEKFRNKNHGRLLVQKAEEWGKTQECRFSTVNTMDWEAREFYEKLGYNIEFKRNGYENDSIMYFLRKDLTS